MSISIFTQSRTKDMTALKTFLDENKAGTFLENATLEVSTSAVTNDTLTITLGESEIKLVTFASDTQNNVAYTGANMTASLKGDYGWNGAYPYISKLMLCSNGFVVEYMRRNGSDYLSSIEHPAYPVAVTIDSTGKLAMVYWTYTSLSVANYPAGYEYYAIAYDSLSVVAVNVVPQNNAQLTSLAAIIPTTNDNSITLPHVYVAVNQQLSGVGLTKIIMNGISYITNGKWYIKD